MCLAHAGGPRWQLRLVSTVTARGRFAKFGQLLGQFAAEHAAELGAAADELVGEGLRHLPPGARPAAKVAADALVAGSAASLAGAKLGVEVPQAVAQVVKAGGPRAVHLLEEVLRLVKPSPRSGTARSRRGHATVAIRRR